MEKSDPKRNVIDVSTERLPLALDEVFRNPNDCTLEIGFGEGEFIIELARANPAQNHVGIEIKTYRVKKAVRKLKRESLPNLRFLHTDAVIAMSEIFAPDSFRTVYINFPDPWPKEKHHKHRIFSPYFLSLLSRSMTPDGIVEIVSDHEEYVAYVRDSFEEEPHFRRLVSEKGHFRDFPHRPESKFEQLFKAKGKEIFYLRYSNAKGGGGGS